MGQFTREEIEAAFTRFQERAAAAGQSGDWTEWADCFTEDAKYYEHHYGQFEGRAQILQWITTTMAEPINRDMVDFPADWYVIDEDRGWIVCKVWNRMKDPGDGSVHQEYNLTVLHYAGGGRFSYEEDIYNPHHFGTMLAAWEARRDELSARPAG